MKLAIISAALIVTATFQPLEVKWTVKHVVNTKIENAIKMEDDSISLSLGNCRLTNENKKSLQ